MTTPEPPQARGRTCARCILDERDDPEISFDAAGVCSNCRSYDATAKLLVPPPDEAENQLREQIAVIKAAGKNRPYDCLIGLSGGVDSSYLAWVAKQRGLRPLAVHFDNGWNSELAVSNIEGIVSRLGFDLTTYVINWTEFKDLQLAYLKASVVDIEAVTDHAIIATMWRLAAQHRIKYILSGTNIVTEAVLPRSWVHNKNDDVNIRAIHAAFGTVPLKTFPFFGWRQKNWFQYGNRIKSFSPLNLVPYLKDDAKRVITDELGWRDYGGKHYESVWTRFYQGHILVKKFGIEKRKAHLSNLICSRQITREEALGEMQKPGYDPALEKQDMEFVLNKLGLDRAQWAELMARPPRKHTEFETERRFTDRHPLLKPLRPIARFVRRLAT
jgi:N-acetyl sugar amidotransferase